MRYVEVRLGKAGKVRLGLLGYVEVRYVRVSFGRLGKPKGGK